MSAIRPRKDRGSPGPGLLALMGGGLAGLAVIATLAAPGITIDEPLDVRPGRTYVQTFSRLGLGFFEPATVDAVFRDNAEHPPLGRWLLGIASTLGQPIETFAMGGADPRNVYVVAGRLAPACCFAALVALVIHASARRYGTVAGLAAGFGLSVTPRVFAHAHLGALDTFITFFWVLALLATERALAGKRPELAMIGAGGAWGLALLTKIHAWLLIPIVFFLMVARLGVRRAIVPFAVWSIVGLVVFVAGWPWLWYDSLPRFARFLGTGVERATIQVTYFGQVYPDREVPWHYPWVYFLITVPVGLHLLGLVGLSVGWKGRREDRFPLLLLGSVLFLLILFSTRVPVYDGDRLFLMAFPLWAILVGRGFAWIWERLAGHSVPRALLGIALLGQGYGVIALHPYQLSYYNLLVGGLAGAERLGLELTFWGDAVDDSLLTRLALESNPGETAALVPTLYPGQGIMTTSRALASRDLILADQEAWTSADWLVVSRRSAYLPPELVEALQGATPVAVRARQGVWLSALYRRPGRSPANANPVFSVKSR
ncbi:MAG: ArnT family glycosyltransferase [Isosphaeraceae bacterium]